MDHDTPPYGTALSAGKLSGNREFFPHKARFATGALTNRTGPAPGGVARALTARDGPVPWLRGAAAARITPALRAFVAEGWTPCDLARALANVHARRWDRPAGRVRYPTALLARFLRRIDPAADRPGLLDQMEADQRREARHREQLEYAARRAAAGEPTPAWHAVRRELEL